MPRKEMAHSFIYATLLDSRIAPKLRVNPMFGCHAIYVDERIVLITRHSKSSLADNGLWVVVQAEFRKEIRREFKSLRPITLFSSMKEGGPTWLCLSEDLPNFEEEAHRIVDLVIAEDPRLGKIPKSKLRKTSRKKKTAKRKPARKKRK